VNARRLAPRRARGRAKGQDARRGGPCRAAREPAVAQGGGDGVHRAGPSGRAREEGQVGPRGGRGDGRPAVAPGRGQRGGVERVGHHHAAEAQAAPQLTAFGPAGEVTLPNPSHVKPESDWPAQPWYAYGLKLKDGREVGVAVVDHPKNPPSLWHNQRDVRMLNPCVVAPAEVKLKANEPLVLRYRVVAFDGPVQKEQLDRLAKQWRAE